MIQRMRARVRAQAWGWLLRCGAVGTALSCAGDGAASEPTPRAHWVFLREESAPLSAAEMLALSSSLPREAWARRGEGALPEAIDRPLDPELLRRIAERARIRCKSRWLRAVSVDATPEQLAAIRSLDGVSSVRPVARGATASLGPAFGPSGEPLEVPVAAYAARPGGEESIYGAARAQLTEIGVDDAHAAGFTGAGVRLMMIDTGFRKDHVAFAEVSVSGERDFVFGDSDTQNEAEDNSGQHFHGTYCWSACGGYAPSRLVGPAYGADFYLAKTEDIRSETHAEEDHYVAALEWADSAGVFITSASLTYLFFDDETGYGPADLDGETAVITRAIDVAAARGLLCVNAAGNYGDASGSIGTPADADSVLSVGAVDSSNVIAGFSARGPTADGRIKPEVVARGVLTACANPVSSEAFGFNSGTSLATPLVAGAAALVAEAHPEWSADEIRSALLGTADRSAAPGFDYGWGRIDVWAAIGSAPITYPLPFSTSSPPDGAEVDTLGPLLEWRASADPDGSAPLRYSVRLTPLDPTGEAQTHDAGADTTLRVPEPLTPDTHYRWEVFAEDVDGLRRAAREASTFHTPPATTGPSWPERPPRGLQVSLGPNPFSESLPFRAVLSERVRATLDWAIVTAAGRRIAAGRVSSPSGRFEGSWDARDGNGERVPAGVYYLELRAGTASAQRTVIRLPGAAAGSTR